MKFCVPLVSGGMDTAAALYDFMQRRDVEETVVNAVTFDYGQRARREITQAGHIASYMGVKHDVIDVSSVFRKTAYGAQLVTDDGDAVVKPYVPLRNTIFIALAAQFAESLAYGLLDRRAQVTSISILHGARPREHMPDRTEPFVSALTAALNAGSDLWANHNIPIRVEMPLRDISLRETVSQARGDRHFWQLLSLTWSCYEDGDYPCGACLRCYGRMHAFEGEADRDAWWDNPTHPIHYGSYADWRRKVEAPSDDLLTSLMMEGIGWNEWE